MQDGLTGMRCKCVHVGGAGISDDAQHCAAQHLQARLGMCQKEIADEQDAIGAGDIQIDELNAFEVGIDSVFCFDVKVKPHLRLRRRSP